MSTIIKKIRAEIERLKKMNEEMGYKNERERYEASGYESACDKILYILDTLEEEPVELEEEIERYLSTEWELDEDLNKNEPIFIYDCTWEDLKIFARHFAQWQKEQDSVKAHKDWTETKISHIKELKKAESNGYHKGLEDGETIQKEQMMKDAVEGEIIFDEKAFGYKDILAKIPSTFNVGDKVKLIFIKED